MWVEEIKIKTCATITLSQEEINILENASKIIGSIANEMERLYTDYVSLSGKATFAYNYECLKDLATDLTNFATEDLTLNDI